MNDFPNDAPLQQKKDKVRIKLRREEREYFPKLFDTAKTKGTNKVSGDGAVVFFRKSRLSPEMLGKIWSLGAQTNNAYMDRDEFYVALRLIALAQSNREVSLKAILRNDDSPLPYFDGIPMPKIAPPTNPSTSMMRSEEMMNSEMMNAAMMNAAMMNSAMMNQGMMNPGMMNQNMMGNMGVMNNPSLGMMNTGMMSGGMPTVTETKKSPYAITQEDAEKYSRIYDALDKGRTGSITADQMTLLLKKTRLPDEVLGQVWELADVNDSGNFNKSNVIIILHLLVLHKEHIPIPQTIPLDLKAAVEGFLQGRPIQPSITVPAPSPMPIPSPLPMVPAIMPAASDPSDPFAEIENGQALGMYNFPGTGFPSQATMPTGGSMMQPENSMVSDALKSALQELQTLNPEKERLRNSIAMYRDMLAKEEETLNAQMAAFRDVAAEYNDMLKKVSGGGARQEQYAPTNGSSNRSTEANPTYFDFS